jgi:hypothetical protein
MTTKQKFYTCNNNKCSENTDCKVETANCFSDLDKCTSICEVIKPDSVHDYCKDPSKFKDILTDAEILDYNQKCQALTGWNKFTSWSGDTIQNMVEGMIGTTNGREILGIIFLKGQIEKGITEYGLRTAFEKLVSDKLLSKFTTDIAEIGIKEVGVMALSAVGSCLALVTEAALVSLEIALPFLAPIEAALQLFMLMGMLIDMWDPCDLKQQIGPEYVNTINDQYNKAFVNAFSIQRGDNLEEDLNKRLIYRLGIWPIEFYMDNTYIADAIKSINKTDEYDKKRGQYQTLYLQYAVDLPKVDKLEITASSFKNLNNPNDIFFKLSNKNSVVENFLKKYWVYMIIIIILLIILFIFIIHKLNKNVR